MAGAPRCECSPVRGDFCHCWWDDHHIMCSSTFLGFFTSVCKTHNTAFRSERASVSSVCLSVHQSQEVKIHPERNTHWNTDRQHWLIVCLKSCIQKTRIDQLERPPEPQNGAILNEFCKFFWGNMCRPQVSLLSLKNRGEVKRLCVSVMNLHTEKSASLYFLGSLTFAFASADHITLEVWWYQNAPLYLPKDAPQGDLRVCIRTRFILPLIHRLAVYILFTRWHTWHTVVHQLVQVTDETVKMRLKQGCWETFFSSKFTSILWNSYYQNQLHWPSVWTRARNLTHCSQCTSTETDITAKNGQKHEETGCYINEGFCKHYDLRSGLKKKLVVRVTLWWISFLYCILQNTLQLMQTQFHETILLQILLTVFPLTKPWTLY